MPFTTGKTSKNEISYINLHPIRHFNPNIHSGKYALFYKSRHTGEINHSPYKYSKQFAQMLADYDNDSSYGKDEDFYIGRID